MYRDTIDIIYALGEDATPLVQRGDTVTAGDDIATGYRPAAVVPYAALLRLSADAAAAAITRQDGVTCTVGASLGARRIGLMTHTVPAPASGDVRSLPKSGALTIKDEATTYDYRAHYTGTVRDSSHQAIIITSDIVRCVYAFAEGLRGTSVLHIEPALLGAASAQETVRQLPQAASSTVIAHISDADHLTAMVRSFDGTLFVGSVTEPVAWALQERSPPALRRRKGAGIVVLDGIGDAQDGVRAVAPFRHLAGAAVTVDRFTQTIMIIRTSDLLADDETFPVPDPEHHAKRRDPAHYGFPCDAVSAPAIAVTRSGTRALCVTAIGDTVGGERIPTQNLQQLPVSGD